MAQWHCSVFWWSTWVQIPPFTICCKEKKNIHIQSSHKSESFVYWVWLFFFYIINIIIWKHERWNIYKTKGKFLFYIYNHLASGIKPETCGNLFAFQITINGLRASNYPSFHIFTPEWKNKKRQVHKKITNTIIWGNKRFYTETLQQYTKV